MKKNLRILIFILAAIVLIYGSYILAGSYAYKAQAATVARAFNAKEARAAREAREKQAQCEKQYREQLAAWVYAHSTKISMTTCGQIVNEVMAYRYPLFLLALIQAESEFSPTALSSAQAVGLGQIRWSVWGKILQNAGVLKEARDLYDISGNIRAIDYILNTLLKEVGGHPVKALERYVGGQHKKYIDQVSYNYLHLSLIKREAMG